MLTIKNIYKLEGWDVVDGWSIGKITEASHNNTYIFKLKKDNPYSFQPYECTIMLEREGRRIYANQPGLSYFFIVDSKRTNRCVSVDYISDKDNMLNQLAEILGQNGI